MTSTHFVVHRPDGTIRCCGFAHEELISLHAAAGDRILVVSVEDAAAVRTDPASHRVISGQLVKQGPDIETARARKLTQLEEATPGTMCAPFLSKALGTPHQYLSSPDDQMALLHAVVAGGPLECAPGGDLPTKVDHTAAQARQVHADYMAICRRRRQKHAAVRAAISRAADHAEIEQISLDHLTKPED